MLPIPQSPTLFPYTTLFRSLLRHRSNTNKYEETMKRWQLQLLIIIAAGAGWAILAAQDAEPQWLARSEEHTSELQSPCNLVCRLLLEKNNEKRKINHEFKRN